MATNPWQAWCQFGQQDEPERLLVRASVPVRQLTLDVLLEDAPYLPAETLCDDPTGIIDQVEISSIQLTELEQKDRLHLSVNAPVWGVRYGVRLPLKSVSGIPEYGEATWDENVPRTFAAEFEKLFHDHGVEITLFAIKKGREPKARCYLKPVMRAPSNTTKEGREWPIGFGVAGRAAWLAKAGFWVPNEKVAVDCYLPEDNEKRHTAIFAVPIRGTSGFVNGVLSCATRQQDNFAKAVGKASEGQQDQRTGLEWCFTLAETIERAL